MNSEELQSLAVEDGVGSVIPIAYRFRNAEPGRPVFIWFCGFKSDMDSIKATALAEWTRRKGAGFLRFDYSGHGKSGGVFTEGTVSAWLDQAAAVCQCALAPGERTVLVGSSMGGWIALLLTRQWHSMKRVPPPAGITLIAPAWDMTRMMWERSSEEARAAVINQGVFHRPSAYGDPYPITRTLLDDGEQHLFRSGPISMPTPVRIIHGRNDADVPWRHSLDLLDVLDCNDMRLTLIKDAEHRLSRPQDLDALFSILDEFA